MDSTGEGMDVLRRTIAGYAPPTPTSPACC
jgi:hypothetical protein